MDIREIPDWYWTNGLYDAIIVDYGFINLNYDYRERKPIRSCFTLTVDSSHALYTTSIRMIKFYNVKSSPVIADIRGWWWIEDQLFFDDVKKRWHLNICVGSRKTASMWISFFFDAVEIVYR